MNNHRITDPQNALQFLEGGKAYFTLQSAKTGTRYTYRVKASEDRRVRFVSVMTGSDNTNSYTYMGMIRDGVFQQTAKSKISHTDPRFQAFSWAYNNLVHSHLSSTLEFWHEGRCGCCGRRLTVPESIETGIGPECKKKYGRG